MFTARYGMIPYIKQITFRLLKVDTCYKLLFCTSKFSKTFRRFSKHTLSNTFIRGYHQFIFFYTYRYRVVHDLWTVLQEMNSIGLCYKKKRSNKRVSGFVGLQSYGHLKFRIESKDNWK